MNLTAAIKKFILRESVLTVQIVIIFIPIQIRHCDVQFIVCTATNHSRFPIVCTNSESQNETEIPFETV